MASISRPPPPTPQTASRGDATACAVPLKAAGSVLPFSTGCQNMQIRGPESAAKSRRKGRGRRVTGSAPCMALPGLARRPATLPAAAATAPPSRARPGSHSRPRPRAGRSPPPKPPLPGREEGGSRGRQALHALIPAGAGTAAERSPRARRAGGGQPGGAVPPRCRSGGSWRGEEEAGCWRGSRAAGIPPLPKRQRRSGGDRALPATPSSPPSAVEGRERGCHPPPSRRAAREFLPRAPGPRGPPTA